MPSEVTGQNSGTRRMFENMPARPGITLLILFAGASPGHRGVLDFVPAGAFLFPLKMTTLWCWPSQTTMINCPRCGRRYWTSQPTQVNEYKLVFAHSIVAAEIELTRHLNFAVLTTLGNLFLLPIGYFLWLTYQEDGMRSQSPPA